MASHAGGKRPFPALVIVSLVLLVCLFPGQYWLPRLLPGISGLASINASLLVLDLRFRLPFTIDLILVPALFILLYTLISSIYPAGNNLSMAKSLAHRLVSAFSATIILLSCVTFAGLVSYVLDDHLPRQVRNGLDSLGMSADLSLRGYKPAHLQGNIIALLGLITGIVIAIIRLKKPPAMQKTTPLTPQQRETPYQRMLQQRQTERQREQPQKQPGRPFPANPRPSPAQKRPSPVNPRPTPAIGQRPLCYNHPLPTLQPEAVNYRPM